MKGSVIIILTYIFISGCGYGQYPQLRIVNGKIMRKDSVKSYYEKYILFKGLMDGEIERINKHQNPVVSKKLFIYQDSCLKYYELLNRKKK